MNDRTHYLIKTPADFLKIPPEKLQHALKDFYNWLEYSRAFQVAGELPELEGWSLDLSKFVWVDDGLHEIIPVFETKEPAEEVKP